MSTEALLVVLFISAFFVGALVAGAIGEIAKKYRGKKAKQRDYIKSLERMIEVQDKALRIYRFRTLNNFEPSEAEYGRRRT